MSSSSPCRSTTRLPFATGARRHLLLLCALAGCDSPRSETRRSDDGARDAATVKLECGAQDGLAIFEQRIEPLFVEDRPQSCNQCHLAGMDLSAFVRSDPCETFACLVEQNLVDTKEPRKSRVLSWIGRAAPDSRLITADIIDAEYQGFLEWIAFESQCGTCDDAVCESTDAGSGCPLVYGSSDSDASAPANSDCSDEALYTVFSQTIYAERGRCSPCHSSAFQDDEVDAPRWIDVSSSCERGAQQTLWNVLNAGYIDANAPEQSLLLLKPLAEDEGGVVHGGHDKFYDRETDPGYLAFAEFIDKLVTCRPEAASRTPRRQTTVED